MEFASNITFKACVENSDGNSLTQYFALNKRGECTYESLRVKLMNEFSCLSRKQFTITWMDYESDMIKITNDDDLLIAICNIKNDVKKLYVQVDEVNNKTCIGAFSGLTINNTNDEKHVGVICNVCSGSVYGLRYKCIKCPDFDLCRTCEMNGHHSNHIMTRFKRPIQKDQKGQFKESIRRTRFLFDGIDFE